MNLGPKNHDEEQKTKHDEELKRKEVAEILHSIKD